MMDDIINQMPASMDNTTPVARRVQRVRHELRLRELRVLHTAALGPGFVSVTLGGDALTDFVSLGFDDHVKVFLDTGAGEPVKRDYTPRRFDAARRELTIEFALHGPGPASDWARQAAPGQRLVVGGPRGSMVLPVDWDWQLLAGDATALPAIARRLEELPAGARVTVLAQVDHPDDRRVWTTAADVQTLWTASATNWLAALRTLDLPPGEGFAWCAGEAAVMAQARAILARSHGLPREAMRVAAYWKRGAEAYHAAVED